MSWKDILKQTNEGFDIANSKLREAKKLTNRTEAFRRRYGDKDSSDGVNLLYQLASLNKHFKQIERENDKSSLPLSRKLAQEAKKGIQLVREGWDAMPDIQGYTGEEYGNITIDNYQHAETRPLPNVYDKATNTPTITQPNLMFSERKEGAKVVPLIAQYFQMYQRMGKGIPSMKDIENEEGRFLNGEEQAYYKHYKERLQ